MTLFETLIGNIKKSMGGGGSSTSEGATTGTNDDPGDGAGIYDPEDGNTIEASALLKALTDEVEALRKSNDETAKSIRELVELIRQDNEFKKSIGEGLCGVLETVEKIAGSPASRRGVTNAAEAGIQKGNVGDGNLRRHRQLTVDDKNELADVIANAGVSGELTAIEVGKLETQINKSIRDPNFQIEPKLLAFLERKWPAKKTA